jgi:hypothetical protein
VINGNGPPLRLFRLIAGVMATWPEIIACHSSMSCIAPNSPVQAVSQSVGPATELLRQEYYYEVVVIRLWYTVSSIAEQPLLHNAAEHDPY